MKKKYFLLFLVFLIVGCRNFSYYKYSLGLDNVAKKAQKNEEPMEGNVRIYITCCFDSVFVQLHDGDTLLWDNVLDTDMMTAFTRVIFYNRKSEESKYRFVINKYDTTYCNIMHIPNQVSWIELDRDQLTKKVIIKSVDNRPR